MAFQNIWTGGAADNDLNTAGNWSPAAPASTEAALFTSEYTGVAGPTVDMASLTAVDLALLWVGPGYTQTIGGSGAELDISANKVHYQGTSGKLWYKDGGDSTDVIICDSTAADPVSHDCLAVTGATNTLLNVLRGKCTVTGGTVTRATVGARNSGSTEAYLVVNSGVTITTDITQYGGLCTSLVNPTYARVFGGTWTQSAGGAIITDLEVFGGRVNLNVAGTYVRVRHYGGIIDLTNAGGVKTFTNYWKYPGAVLIGDGNRAVYGIPTLRVDV